MRSGESLCEIRPGLKEKAGRRLGDSPETVALTLAFRQPDRAPVQIDSVHPSRLVVCAQLATCPCTVTSQGAGRAQVIQMS